MRIRLPITAFLDMPILAPIMEADSPSAHILVSVLTFSSVQSSAAIVTIPS
jgi:hypothetical protein